MQTVADMRGVGVKNREKFADVLCGRPLSVLNHRGLISVLYDLIYLNGQTDPKMTIVALSKQTGFNQDSVI